ncbi:hypothetical protein OUZ56_008421 [Daphnia magna]|uniref:Uncharacterized protein n=1 Tax=Daphnia magna TaxID=35525 RepID=A0ABR0ACX8_9CRUS|nr:hypothetical protein OUZ56_008421 [Daphnia magna]
MGQLTWETRKRKAWRDIQTSEEFNLYTHACVKGHEYPLDRTDYWVYRADQFHYQSMRNKFCRRDIQHHVVASLLECPTSQRIDGNLCLFDARGHTVRVRNPS